MPHNFFLERPSERCLELCETILHSALLEPTIITTPFSLLWMYVQEDEADSCWLVGKLFLVLSFAGA